MSRQHAHRIGALVAAFLLLPHLATARPTPPQQCAAAKSKAAWKKAAAKGKCYQTSFIKDVAVDPTCLAKAEQKFDAAIAKAEAKGGCINTGDAAAIESAVDACVADIVALTPATQAGCTIPATCSATPACLSLVDISGQSAFGLRVAHLALSQPAALTAGLIAATLRSGVTLNDGGACDLNGGGTFNWLLQIDKNAHTLRTGGAAPVVDPVQGYSFVSGLTFGAPVAPLTTALSLVGDGTLSSTAGDVSIPVYLDASGVAGFVLPLRGLTVSGQLAGDQGCIGNYNAAGLVAPACVADSTHPTFIDGGTLHAHITLEDADQVVISALGQSLCVLLSGNAALYGDGGNPAHCARSSGAIVFAGDVCSTGGSCTDALDFSATFAASGVVIH